MAEQKIFAGPRLRRFRTRLGRTQSQMATEIGISASYLNLIERNQRPLTVQVILKLSSAFDFDISELHSADAGARLDELKAIFTDPLLAAELPSTDELGEVADAAPNVGIAITKLHRAYRETLARLTDLSRDMAGLTADLPAELQQDNSPDKPVAGTGVTAALSPHDRVMGWFETEGPWFADLEATADELAASLVPRDDPFGAIKAALARDHHIDVRILPVDTMPAELSRFDRHAMRLYLSERLPLIERPFFAAIQLVAMAERQCLDLLTDGAGLDDPEARRLCRTVYCRRMAAAVLLPAMRLQRLATDTVPDIAALSRRNTLSPARVMARLAAVGGSGGPGAPAFLLTVDAAGTVLNRVPGSQRDTARFPFARFGNPCGQLPLFDAPPPDEIAGRSVTFPDGRTFDTVTTAQRTMLAGAHDKPPAIVTMIAFASAGDGQASTRSANSDAAISRPVGVTCRLCERTDCPARTSPSATEPAAFRDDLIGLAHYETV